MRVFFFLLVAVAIAPSAAWADPCLGSGTGTPKGVKGMAPADVRAFNGMSGSLGCGEGISVAVVITGGTSDLKSNLTKFSAAYGLPAPTDDNFEILTDNGPCGTPGDAVEANIDIDAVHTTAPKAKILVACWTDPSIESKGKAIEMAIAHGAKIVSMSWGEPEVQGDVSVLDPIFAAHPEVTFIAGSGDSGANPGANGQPRVAYPAASVHVLAVGAAADVGSTLTAWSKSGGGASKLITRPNYQILWHIPNSGRALPDLASSGSSDDPVIMVGDKGFTGAIGTSVASPLVAGMMAVVLQDRPDRPLGPVAPHIYSERGRLLRASLFQDVQAGQDSAFQAGAGFDFMTGLGVPKMDALIRYLREQ